MVHFGIVLIFIGITGSAFQVDHQQDMVVGDRMQLGRFTLEMREIAVSDNPNYSSQKAFLTISRGGQQMGELVPERRFYKSSQQPTTEVAIRPMINRDLMNGDVYIVFEGMAEDKQHAVMSAHLNPLVNWIWVGGLVLVLGTLIALLPSLPSGGTAPSQSKTVRKSVPEEKEKDEVLASYPSAP